MPTADELLSADTVSNLARVLARAARGRRSPALLARAANLDGLGFSTRVTAVRDAALTDLPEDWPAFEAVLRTALEDPAFTGWMTFPVNEAVAVRGLAAFEPALALLHDLTPRLTAESAVRPFLRADPGRALAVITGWTADPDPHVRRLASEGTRPRLPWAPHLPAFIADPRPAVPVLDALRRDESEYVRRSVANHLNDISRDHPGLAVDIAAGWRADPAPTTDRVVRHGLRTLIKAGHPGALTLLGHDPDAPVTVGGPVVTTPRVAVGSYLVFDYAVTHTGALPAELVIDYVVHHVKANGTRTPKVFKLTTRRMAPGETLTGTKRHSFKPITTRRYHSGEHLVQLQVNGRVRGEAGFALDAD
ncbi:MULTISPECIES: DNA alkylation repair protein [unclassified Streptomyces]|uniref:DNA alkylation repair protein n=1 Tax=unclassified Streptomyces TaxID=2593676 RepID=UPI000DC76D2D|nr:MULTISPECIES: DNA alkylation repair protein [unclassified Streptomyces]AWZ09596.1 DNA alkylation repair protein [Streptomyces sp. ICC4]AWZ17350.1 DNA alkylation repair protein [Streptomyces sp. ICC1]